MVADMTPSTGHFGAAIRRQTKRRGDPTGRGYSVIECWRYDFDASGNLVSKVPSLPIIGDLTSGSETISGGSVGDIAQLYVGAPVAHTALPGGTTVSTISSSSFTVSHAATSTVAAASITLTGEGTTYSWDEDNRLVEVGLPGSVTVAYEYDVLGRMLTKTHSVNGTTRYEWDGMDIMREYGPSTTGSAIYDSAHCDTDHYGWTGTTNYYVVNGVLMGVDFDGGGTNAVISDAMGHVRALVDPSGNTVFSASYSAYGDAINVTDSTPCGAFAARYVGQYGVRWDADLQIHYVRQRWLDAAGLQRFVSRDTVRGVNRYQYATNHPTDYIDDSGLVAVTPGLLRAFNRMLKADPAYKAFGSNAAQRFFEKCQAFALAALMTAKREHAGDRHLGGVIDSIVGIISDPKYVVGYNPKDKDNLAGTIRAEPDWPEGPPANHPEWGTTYFTDLGIEQSNPDRSAPNVAHRNVCGEKQCAAILIHEISAHTFRGRMWRATHDPYYLPGKDSKEDHKFTDYFMWKILNIRY